MKRTIHKSRTGRIHTSQRPGLRRPRIELLETRLALAADVNVVKNGSFEDYQGLPALNIPTWNPPSIIAPWYLQSGNVDLVNSGFTPPHGPNAVDLIGTGQPGLDVQGALNQLLYTEQNVWYEVWFMATSNTQGGTAPNRYFDLWWEGIHQRTFETTNVWQTHRVYLQATHREGPSSKLGFFGRTENSEFFYGALLDNISAWAIDAKNDAVSVDQNLTTLTSTFAVT